MWDIHGNPLKKGHCEVHPYIAQEYPCYVCQEQQRVANIHRQASEIVEYQAPLTEKMDQVRQMATITADQYTVNLLGYINTDIEQMLDENKRLREALETIAKLPLSDECSDAYYNEQYMNIVSSARKALEGDSNA